MVDMSPAAVTQRLRLMGELWELSARLVKSKKVDERSEDLGPESEIVETTEDRSQNRER